MNDPVNMLVQEIVRRKAQNGDVSGLVAAMAATHKAICQSAAQIARLEQINSDAEKMARTDALTGIMNRSGGDEALRKIFETARAANKNGPAQTVVVLFFDIDHFKSVNDTFGHDVGDSAIKAVANAAKTTFAAKGDVVARMGGEEFMVAFSCPRASCIETAEQKAEALRKEIGKIFVGPKNERNITASVGVAMVQPDERHARRVEETLHKTKKRADTALYHAKETGRNRVAFYDRMPPETADAVEAMASRPATIRTTVPAAPALTAR